MSNELFALQQCQKRFIQLEGQLRRTIEDDEDDFESGAMWC